MTVPRHQLKPVAITVRVGAREPRGWYSRGYLPHFDGGEITQSLTLRLFDSLPEASLLRWREELAHLPADDAVGEYQSRLQRYLDRGHGACWLRIPDIAQLVESALLFFDGERYRAHVWVVMPNHVHALLTPLSPHSLEQILHSWKSFTSKEANRLLGRRGRFWQKESFDRYIRNADHFDAELAYIEANPVVAGLCETSEAWPYGSARLRTVAESLSACGSRSP